MSADRRCIYTVVPQGLAAPGGISRMAAYYVRDWEARGRTPALRVLDSYGPRDRRFMPLHFAACCLRVLTDGLRGRIALLHVHMAEDGSTLRKSLLLLLGRALGLPVVVHMHGARFAESCARLPRGVAALLARVLSRAEMVLVLGAASQRFLVDSLKLPAAKVVVLANAVPDPCPPPVARVAPSCRLLFLGALTPRKGLDVLLAALANPALAGGNWQVDIAGNGDPGPWRDLAARHGVAHRITWHGWQAQTQPLLAEASLLVLPSRHEGLPMVILEAMANGLPVIASDVGEVAEAVTHGVTGLLVPAGSAGHLAVALAALIADPAQRVRMGQAGRARFERDFDIAAFGARLAALLAPIAASPRPARGLRQMAALGSGAAAGQALVMLTSPLLTRFYPAAAFGAFGLFSGVVSSIGAVAALKYEQAILLEQPPVRAAAAFRLCLIMSLGAAVATPAAAWLIGAPQLRLLLLCGGPAVLVAGLVNALSAWAVREGRFRGLGVYQTARSGLAVVLQLGGAAIGGDAGLLVGGQVLGQGLAAGLLGTAPPMRGPWRWSAIAAIVRDHRQLALFGAPQTLAHLLSVNLPILLLPFCCGPTAAGMFWLAYRCLILPSQILTESMRSVLFRRVGPLADQPRAARQAMRRAAIQLGLLSLPIALVLLAAGPALFALVFGPSWRPAGVDAALMAAPWWLETVAAPSSVIVVLLRLQRRYLAIELASLTARAAALLLGARLGGVVGAIGLYAVAAALSSAALMRLAATGLRTKR